MKSTEVGNNSDNTMEVDDIPFTEGYYIYYYYNYYKI